MRAIADSHTAIVRQQASTDARGRYLLSNDALHDYRAMVTELDYHPGQPLPLPPAICAALKVSDGSSIRLVAL
jgi:arginine N-succinyltransferase